MSTNQQPVSPGAKPHVIIVGAGLGGLVLALLLERAGVPYVVLEKTSSIKTLGKRIQIFRFSTAKILVHEEGGEEEGKGLLKVI